PGADGRYSDALDRLTALAGPELDARIDELLGSLGIGTLGDRPTAELSGGQAAKAALAAAMLSRFDITLLDEPTNDLDFEGIDLLRSFVERRHGAMVIVSHDRDFLDRTVTSVLEIDEHDHRGRLYGGGWSSYLAERATARRHAEDDYAVYEAQRRELTARARREREWATKGVRGEQKSPRDNDRAQRAFRIERTEQLASRSRRTQRALQSMEVVDKPWEGWQLRYTIEQAPRGGSIVARLDAAVVERGTFRLGPIDLQLDWADRVALTGPNGAGKSTLVAALLGRIPLAGGTRWLGPSVVVGELGQARGGLDPERSVADSLALRCHLDRSATRSLLAKFGLGADEVDRPSPTLSPGQRTRAELATFQALGVNLLVLDEPTNHLDLPAIEQLESALDGYDGTLVVISHDRRLLESVRLTRRIALD
ncbi:MAG TPA: ATP-binding cassette domain-containing protein, partial [Acidimicrobiales bacterium]